MMDYFLLSLLSQTRKAEKAVRRITSSRMALVSHSIIPGILCSLWIGRLNLSSVLFDFISPGIYNLKGYSITEQDLVISPHNIKCASCDFTAKMPSSFEKHINEVHKKVRPYVCTGCPKKFAGKLHMQDHFRKAHSDTKRKGSKPTDPEDLAVFNMMSKSGW
jgi:uncharacterized Zn-finger protein